jgi:hypothetical protein
MYLIWCGVQGGGFSIRSILLSVVTIVAKQAQA